MDIYDSVIHSVQETLLREGFDKQQAEQLSIEAADKFRRKEGGRQVYLPSFSRSMRNSFVSKFSGHNMNALCRYYGVSIQTGYRWVKNRR